jgi:stearoyl-CoA desaturase (delta-9 desaturase)
VLLFFGIIAHPTAAQHGFKWYEVDMNWYGIRTLKTLGLAWDVKRARLAVWKKGWWPRRMDG